MTNQTKLEALIENLTWAIPTQQRQIAKFQEAFASDPAYALAWSDQVFADAAKLEVYTRLKQIADSEIAKEDCDHDAAYAVIKQFAMEKVMDYARQVPSSTSVPSNLMENRRREAWANVVSGYGSLLK